jgi:hypothetical protein
MIAKIKGKFTAIRERIRTALLARGLVTACAIFDHLPEFLAGVAAIWAGFSVSAKYPDASELMSLIIKILQWVVAAMFFIYATLGVLLSRRKLTIQNRRT